MTWAIVLLGAPLVVAAAIRAAASPAKAAMGLLGTGIIVFAPPCAAGAGTPEPSRYRGAIRSRVPWVSRPRAAAGVG